MGSACNRNRLGRAVRVSAESPAFARMCTGSRTSLTEIFDCCSALSVKQVNI